MLLVENGHVLAALDIVSKERVHAGRRCSAGGLSTVVTTSKHGAGAMAAAWSPPPRRPTAPPPPAGRSTPPRSRWPGSAAVAVTVNVPLAQASEVAPQLGLEDARV